jgi:hypothetical protein
MKSMNRLALWTVFSSVALLGCATVPESQVWQPWTRVSKTTQSVVLHSAFRVEIAGETRPLIGREDFTCDKLRDEVTFLIERRGFQIKNENWDYKLSINYRVERHDQFQFSSSLQTATRTMSLSYSKSLAGAISGLGVSIARAFGATSTSTATSAEQTAQSLLSYTHVLSLEISAKSGGPIWKGEATWDSNTLNLRPDYPSAFQLLLSDLPSDLSVRPQVPEVKQSHVLNYFKLECEGYWFSCPAVPYRITYQRLEPGKEATMLPDDIKDGSALTAYTDLIKTAEFALPLGESKYDNPLLRSLWSKIELGGQYLLGPEKKPVSILVTLKGESSGYVVDECWIANDGEYTAFQRKLGRWKEALQSYYNVYEQ